MNLFIIPSWYPSPQHALAGIFFREQAEIFAKYYPQINIGIGHWGQNDEKLLLWGKDHFKNLDRIFKAGKISPSQNKIADNLHEYFMPAFTWSMKWKGGNIRNIIKATLGNLRKFESDYGKADIIHAHVGYPAGYIADCLSQKLNIPYVVTEHMSPFPFQDFLKKNGDWIDKLKTAYKNASQIISVSAAQRKVFENKGFNGVRVIPNFIDDDHFFPRQKRPVEMVNFFTLARMSKQKGIDVLLRAISLLKDESRNLRFILGGDGEDLEAYKKISADLGIEKQVKWLGALKREQVRTAYQNADIFILPSRHESFGVVVIEALACGKPCIATRCGGPEEIITDAVGMVVEKENPEVLANAILKMAASYQSYPQEKVRAYFNQNFSSKIATAKLKRLYEEVLSAYH